MCKNYRKRAIILNNDNHSIRCVFILYGMDKPDIKY